MMVIAMLRFRTSFVLPVVAASVTMMRSLSAFRLCPLPPSPSRRPLVLQTSMPYYASSSMLLVASEPSSPSSSSSSSFDTSLMWNKGLDFGKGPFVFYTNLNKYLSVFPSEDREVYPEVFTLPRGVYEITLGKPLGIVFEEIAAGNGLYVKDLVPNGNAAQSGRIQLGDVLVGITAVKIVGARYERRMIPARRLGFDIVVNAIASNTDKYYCNDVVLWLERPGEADPTKTDQFLVFWEPPFDNPWKQGQ